MQLPAGWKIVEGPPSVQVQCYSQTIVLEAKPKQAKAGLLTCPPDDSSSALPVGLPGDFVAYRKFRRGDGVVELGIVKVEGEILEGLARIDRIASGKAIESNYLGEFKLTTAELIEVIDALLDTKLVAFEPNTKSPQIRGAFENRCRNWAAPAQGAAELTLKQALDFPRPATPAAATPSASPP
jgi:hypothetical protein